MILPRYLGSEQTIYRVLVNFEGMVFTRTGCDLELVVTFPSGEMADFPDGMPTAGIFR